MYRIKSPVLIAYILFIFIWGCGGAEKTTTTLPGKYDNYTLLSNGWKLTPAGEHVQIGELPLNMLITENEKYAITANSGSGENSISIVDLEKMKEIQRVVVDQTWRGLALNSDETELFVSGANNNDILIYNFNDGKLSKKDSIILGKKYPKDKISITGLAYYAKKNYILAVSKESNSLYVCDLNTKKVIKTVPLGGKCFDVKINDAQTYAYISVWENAEIAEVDLTNFNIKNRIKVGDHPCEMALTKDGQRLFVANANNNSTSIVDLETKKETEKVISSISVDAPYGSTPDAICLSKDETILITANADNNYLALFDVSDKNKSKNLGFIPTGWYPTSVRYLENKNQIIVAEAKGLSSKANPNGPNPLEKGGERDFSGYIAHLFKGTVSKINFPQKADLEDYTKLAYNNTPYISKEKIWKGIQNVIPEEHDGKRSSKINHVFYIIKENRTYDQVYGDIVKGNGDSSLCIFGKSITPNQHNLVENFTLYDNFYVDAEVSADGHNWSTAAYATDYVEKEWPVLYGGNGGSYDFEGGVPIAAPSSGYIWNNIMKKNLTLRNYGEFTGSVKDEPGKYEARDEDLNKFTNHEYPGFNLSISDLDRYKVWKNEFEKYEKGDSLPVFNLLRLPNDHTAGTRKGNLTPQAYVAQNDYALGLIVHQISHSKYWKESIIFIVEDDAQNGPDHVDAHRSTLTIISPFIKRNNIDHTMYSTSSVLKTIELILGLPPMTQYDLSATPILFSIINEADYTPFSVIPPLIDIDQRNTAQAYGSERSEEMNLTKEDAIPDIEFNEIVWKSIKGKNSVMPSPVRSAFVKVVDRDEDED